MASPWAQAKAGQKISAPKQSKYHGYQGQAGGSSSIPSQGKRDAFVQLQKQKFFGDRDVPEERVLRRTRQEGGIKQFKDALLRKGRVASGVTTASGEPVYLTDVPGGRSVSDVAQNLAYRFGPTPREVFGDIGYGLGSIGKGIGNFIGKGGVLGSVASDLFQRIKSGTQQGIETVGGLYDNLRKTLGGEPPVVNYGGSSDITVTEQPMFPYNFETIMKPKPDPLLPSEMSQEQFMESYPELYSQNPMFRQQVYDPIRVSDMDMSGVVASNVGQNIIGNLQNLRNLAQQSNLNKIQFDPFNPNRIGYKDQFMYNNTPVNYNIGIGNQGIEAGLNFAFKKGGSVDKYAGLGYKLK
jgi:hypothetical protein